MPHDWIILAVFVAVYVGMALGRWPWLAVDRTGVAMIGAIVLLVTGAVDGEAAFSFVDFPTLSILFTLMVLSGQFAASGFFDRIAAGLASSGRSPKALLAMVIAAGGGVAALLTNDVIVWAMTPLLIGGLLRRGLDARPYVIALACAANAGSAATLIGNPQNLLIGESGGLTFWPFVLACLPPALAALGIVHMVVSRSSLFTAQAGGVSWPSADAVIIDRRALAKAIAATVAVLVIFTLTEDRGIWSLGVAAALLLSRNRGTRQLLGEVDWPLLLLFAGLFVVTGALGDSAAMQRWTAALTAIADPRTLEAIALVSLTGSNTIGNVPLVMLLLSIIPDWTTGSLHALSLFSTLSGNFLIVGSVANIIAVERAKALGVTIGFIDYARIGVPVTLISLALAYGWMNLAYPWLARLVMP